MICRDARADDVAWLARIALDTYGAVFSTLLPDCEWSRFDEAHFLGRFELAWPRIRIIEKASPLGFSLVTMSHIDMLFIDPAARGHGFGAALLADAERLGAHSLESFAVNLSARRFYERKGWVATEHSSRVFAGAKCDFVRYERG